MAKYTQGEWSERVANAKLIAVAPKLLKACKEVLEKKTNRLGETPRLSGELRGVLEEAVAAAEELG